MMPESERFKSSLILSVFSSRFFNCFELWNGSVQNGAIEHIYQHDFYKRDNPDDLLVLTSNAEND